MAKYNACFTRRYGDSWENKSIPVNTVGEASGEIVRMLIAGYRDITCEVVDSEGEIVAYYERYWRHDDTMPKADAEEA